MKRKKLLRLCLTAAFCPWMAAIPASAVEVGGRTVFRGVDVSVYQGRIDFDALRNSGIRVVYIRAGIGGEEDDRFEDNYEGARDARLSYGFYYYVTARNVQDAKEQAAHFAELLEGKQFNARPVMDFEEFGDLTRQETNAVAQAFLDELQRLTGILPMVYSAYYNTEDLWDRSLSRYPLWVADYESSSPETGIWEIWDGFQYADNGSLPGIEGPVDLDYFTPQVLLYTTERPGEFLPDAPEILRYVVRPGDTLRGIARRFGVSAAALVEENDIQNPSVIYVGESLRIPEEEESDLFSLYTVQKNDNLWNLARRFDTTVAILAKDNYITTPSLIYVGDVLRIPRKS